MVSNSKAGYYVRICNDNWKRTANLRKAMLDLPFNAELAEGTLGRDRFQFYLAQDARYLIGFGRALSVAAAKAPDPSALAFFAGAAREAVLVERALHESYFERFGLGEADLAAIETSPTCLGYTSYLLAVAQTEGYAELIAALLPCFWIYHDVGTAILERQRRTGASDNPYQAWIDTYADDDFAASVRTCIAEVDKAAELADEHTVARMSAAFTRACEYEWMFWDSAYRMESWPTTHLRG